MYSGGEALVIFVKLSPFCEFCIIYEPTVWLGIINESKTQYNKKSVVGLCK